MRLLILTAGIAGGFMLESLAVMTGAGAVHDSWWPQVPLLGFGDAMAVTAISVVLEAFGIAVFAMLGRHIAEAE